MTSVKSRENLPWIEKYRPSSLDEVYGQQDVVDTVRRFVQEGKLPHLLFYGPPGTGKTSMIIALAKEIYGKNYKNMVLELNASDDRGIDVVRDQIKNFASTMQIFSKGFKLIILDEADAMTNVAQNALRRVIEKYTKNTRFCILANYAHKLNPALLSRCTRFRFQPLKEAAIHERVLQVITKENLLVSNEAQVALLKLSQGDMRKALNVLQSCSAAVKEGEEISKEMIYDCIGAPHPEDVETALDIILKEEYSNAYVAVDKIRKTKGLAIVDMITCFVELLKNYELTNTQLAHIAKGFSNIEYGISKGVTDKIATTAVIGVLKGAFAD
ncbi:hypothetical protein PACTADRAFT_49634 [Pachysolen tannophilus NRRL Y-2460]|uniref:AAA+ ATPase domain-containing protein n=1 Tax=Pachysolen tannophilus NRRL Y-2460 TaxID=669874 RepID=A0A1E4TWT0_PACTA|nr:hypothetical protein PACTADRAFT_49634 [Pachysolen tannophilus NRRL Y-2460]